MMIRKGFRWAVAWMAGIGIIGNTAAAPDAGWHTFRGNRGNGAVITPTELPRAIDLARNVLWSAALPGRGLAAPIVVEDRVIITAASDAKQETLHVLCFSLVDGSKQWERRFRATGRTMCHEKSNVAAPSPASDGRFVYAMFSSGDMICLDLQGQVRWIRGLGFDYPNASNSLGLSSSLVVADGTVIVQLETQSDSFAAGISAEDGLNRWKIERPKVPNWTSPVLWTEPGGRVLALLQSSKGLIAVSPRTGETVWSHLEKLATISSASVAGGMVVVPGQGLTALAPQSDGRAPMQVWQSSQIRAGTASPIILGGRVYALNDAGVLSCGDLEDGKRLWQIRLKGSFSSSPVGSGKLIYVVNEAGLGQIVDVSGEEGQVISEFDLKQTVLGTPSIAGNAVLVRSDRKLWALGNQN